MEYVIQDTNIFDLNFLDKIENLINSIYPDNARYYSVKVSFNNNSLIENIEKYYNEFLLDSGCNLENNQYDVLGNILYNVVERFKQNRYKIELSIIEGDPLISDNVVLLRLELKNKLSFSKKFQDGQIIIPQAFHFNEGEENEIEKEQILHMVKMLYDGKKLSKNEYDKIVDVIYSNKYTKIKTLTNMRK